MKRILYISISLLLLLGISGGCSATNKAKALNFNELPAVTSIAKEMSTDTAIAAIETALTANRIASASKVNADGIHAEKKITKPAEYMLDRYHGQQGNNGQFSFSVDRSNWSGLGYQGHEIIPEKEMTVRVFLPFPEIDQVSVQTVTKKSETLHQITIFAGRQDYTRIVIDSTEQNNLLAALYTLCPKLHQ